jgi:methionine biosynthesis protein MetW
MIIDKRPSTAEIKTRPCPECYLCGARGEPLYQGLKDPQFGAPGEWSLKRCPKSECGLLWLDPMPLEEEVVKAYESYFTHSDTAAAPISRPTCLGLRAATWFRLVGSAYQAHRFNYGEGVGRPLGWLLALPALLTRLECDGFDIPLRYLAIPNKGRMLDVGCGDGSAVKTAQDLGWSAEGVDFDPQAVEVARHKGLQVHLGGLTDCRYPDDSFDLVLMNHVIEHVHDPLATLGEIRRLLRVGGMLVVTTPNGGCWGHRHFGADWRGLEPPRHLYIFNGYNLDALAQRAGYARSIVSSTLRITPGAVVQSRAIRRSRRRGKARALTLPQRLYGHAAALAELVMRRWNPLAAHELLLEARK